MEWMMRSIAREVGWNGSSNIDPNAGTAPNTRKAPKSQTAPTAQTQSYRSS